MIHSQVSSAFESSGWVLVERAVRESMARAAAHVAPQWPGAECGFPTGRRELDCLVEGAFLISIFEAILGTADIRLCNAHPFVRRAQDESGGPSSGARLHFDHDTDCLLPPSREPHALEYVNCHIFLEDVQLHQAPMLVFSGTHKWPVVRATEWRQDGRLTSKADFNPGLEPLDLPPAVSICASAGDALFYSSHLLHRAQQFSDPTASRILFAITVCTAAMSSVRRSSWPYPFRNRQRTNQFLAQTTPRVRELLGWPRPDSLYYTDVVLAELEHWYPGIDLSEYGGGAAPHSNASAL